MKFPLLLLFLITHSIYSQNADSLAEKMAITGNFEKEILLRRQIIQTSKDVNEQKFQEFKIKIAESKLVEDREKHSKEVETAIINFRKSENVPFALLLKAENLYFEYLMANLFFERGVEQIEHLYDLVADKSSKEWGKERYSIILMKGRGKLYYGKHQEAIELLTEAYDEAVEVFGRNSIETADVARQMAITYSYMNNYQELLKKADEALAIYEIVQPVDPFILFQQYTGNYQYYKYYGDRKKMKELFSRLKGYYESNLYNPKFANGFHPDYPHLNPAQAMYFYVELQEAHANEKTNEAEKAFKKFIVSVNPSIEYVQFECNAIMSYYLETGAMFFNLGRGQNKEYYQKAYKYFSDGLRFSKSQNYKFGEMQAYMMLSKLSAQNGQWNDVILFSEKGLQNESIQTFNQTQTLRHNLAVAYDAIGNFDKALPIFKEEFDFYSNAGNEADYYSLTNLLETGELFMKKYSETRDLSLPQLAYDNFYLASVIFSRLYRGGEFSDRLYEFVSRINDGLLNSSNRLNKYQDEVIDRIEINQSDYLWSNFLANRTIPDEKSLKLQSQLDSMKLLQKSLAAEISENEKKKEPVQELREHLKNTEKDFDQVNDELKKYDKSFFEFSREDFDVKKIQEELDANEQVVKYILTKVSAYAYIITKDKIRLIALPQSGPIIKGVVSDFISNLKNINPEFSKQSGELYNILWAPLKLDKQKHTIIIPDGFLANLPYEALLSEEGKFLLNEYPISYSYSLKLFEIQRSLKEKFRGNLAAFAPTYEKEKGSVLVNRGKEGNYDLEGAKKEVKTISSFFQSKLFTETDATKENFLKISDDFDIIHLAMHANVDEENPNLSHLVFGNEEPMYLNELYKLKIPAHLAVLSACNTGTGELKEGEGIQSLSRAFTYAGVKSTVMSLWPVPDKQTSQIISDFYANLKNGKSKDEALQLAKGNYLASVTDEALRHPFFWAGFIVSGDTSALEVPNKSGNILWIIVSIVVIAGGAFLIYKKK